MKRSEAVSLPAWQPAGGRVDVRAWAGGALLAAFLLRAIFGARMELMPEEAYYWNYAQHLDIGYLDHPPMVGWVIWATTALFGRGELAVRLGALCCGAVTTLFMYRLTRDLFGTPSAWVSVVLVQALPFFFLSGLLITPDAPLTAAWTATLYFVERALVGERAAAWWLAGVALGLGLLSKYTIALLVLSSAVFMLLDVRSRGWLKRVHPYAAALVACALFAPVIAWNARHGWASFLFQSSRRLAEHPQFALHKLLGSALILLTPQGLAGIVWILMQRIGIGEDADTRRAWRFINVSTWVPVGVFVLFSLRHEVKLDWTGAPWICAIPALSCGIARAREGSAGRRWIGRFWAPTIASLFVLYAAAFYDFAVGIPGLGYPRHAELMPVGWRQLGRDITDEAEEVARREGRQPLVIGMDRYAIASELAFYGRPDALADTSSGHLFGQMGLMYERWLAPDDARGRTLLLVAWSPQELSGAGIEGCVTRLDPIREGRLVRDGELIRPYYYRLAHGYLGPQRR